MTPKEKAKELFLKYYRDSDLLVEELSLIQAKECAMIAVDEIIKSNPTNDNELYAEMVDDAIKYWQEVKKEIENI
jgi:hypothetical protein